MFSDVLQSGEFPKAWKTDRRKPIYKSGGRLSVGNYRLVAIHSIFRKIICSILHERIRSFVHLDDAQNGFRQNRRGTDNILLLNNTIRQKCINGGAYIIVVDFSKAFDRCHIATLLKKLSQKGIRGQTLRLVQSMYTNAQAQISVNGKLGEKFEVTRGVAQGCVLSPLFFDIYIDDLLEEFRSENLGVPIGQFIQGASSFADDLALVAGDEETATKYIEILERWCKENFLEINAKKSGILRIGATKDNPTPNLCVNGNRIRLLEEKDPDREEVEEFKYLGILIPSDGSWQKYVSTRLNRCQQALGKYWRFLKLSDVSVQLKIRVADSLILSHLSYGAEVVCLNEQQTKQIDAMQAKVIRTILQLPQRSSHDAARFLTGQTRPSTERKTRQVQNLQRIRNLQNTQLKNAYDSRQWHQKPYIFQRYEEEEMLMKVRQKRTNVSEEDFVFATTRPLSSQTKKVLKKLNQDAEKAEVTHHLRQNHSEIFAGYSHSHTHPLWKRSSLEVSTFSKWLIGATDLFSDKLRRGAQESDNEDNFCRFCNQDVEESRKHVLSSCHGTTTERNLFKQQIESTSKEKLQEFTEIQEDQKWKWILAGGTSREADPYPLRQNRIIAAKSPIEKGKCVTPVKDKKDPLECLRAYNEYRQILSELEHKHVRIYTDGSHSVKLNTTGFGISAILQDGPTLTKVFDKSIGLGSSSVQQAEMRAVRDALSSLLAEKDILRAKVPVHIFTDSKYTFDASTSVELRGKHFYISQEIHNFAHRIKNTGMKVIMHWLPSHVENTAAGIKRTGNSHADSLANRGRKMSTKKDEKDFIHKVRELILSHSIALINALDRRLQLLSESPDGPSASADDLDACVHAARDSFLTRVP